MKKFIISIISIVAISFSSKAQDISLQEKSLIDHTDLTSKISPYYRYFNEDINDQDNLKLNYYENSIIIDKLHHQLNLTTDKSLDCFTLHEGGLGLQFHHI